MSKLSWLIKLYAEGTRNLQKIMFLWLLINNWSARSYVLLLFIKCAKISDSCIDDKLKKHSLTCWRTMQGTSSQFIFMFRKTKNPVCNQKSQVNKRNRRIPSLQQGHNHPRCHSPLQILSMSDISPSKFQITAFENKSSVLMRIIMLKHQYLSYYLRVWWIGSSRSTSVAT